MRAQVVLQKRHSMTKLEKVCRLQGFFKKGKDRYAEGDRLSGRSEKHREPTSRTAWRCSTFFLFFLLSATQLPLLAQISHGGSPLFFFPEGEAGLRSVSEDASFFVEMPPFDVDSLLADDRLNESNMKGAFRFAHTFFHLIERGKSGHHFTLSDGTKVWQVGIRSKGAYSINLLFSEFDIPVGGQLFVYSADRSHILGSFTRENNPEGGLFPTSPVYGEEIVVEYSEPAGAAFEGKLKITEINHDYRDVLRMEPKNSNGADFNCMPDVLCSEGAELAVNRSAVLLIVNGSTMCSGSMINNTDNDETPYLLTAMHCFNTNPPIHRSAQHYIERAGTVVAFFNYNRPVCNTGMRGVEEMSAAGAHARCIIEPLDVALLELKETPPERYQVYYAGWNIDPAVAAQTAYVSNIHHPWGDLSKYGKSTNPLAHASFNGIPLFDANAFWLVPGWTIGSTHGGSSGSPLFDDNNRIIGALTGGASECAGNAPNGASDLFSRLHLAWQYRTDVDSLRLDSWLDRSNTGATTCSGLESGETSLERLANAAYNDGDGLVTTRVDGSPSDYLFGANLRNTVEFAEEFTLDNPCRIYGAYVLTPPVSSFATVYLHLYDSDGGRPGEKIASTPFFPRYNHYFGGSFTQIGKTMNQGAESFVAWEGEPTTGRQFFVGYELSDAASSFLAYNTQFAHPAATNTAWIKDPINGWTPADQYAPAPMTTALGIQVLAADATDTLVPARQADAALLSYDRYTRVVKATTTSGNAGLLRLYTLSGQLIKKRAFKGETSFVADESLKNRPGIICLSTDEENETIKVIF